MSHDELRLECLKIAFASTRINVWEALVYAREMFAFASGQEDDAALGRAVRDLTDSR